MPKSINKTKKNKKNIYHKKHTIKIKKHRGGVPSWLKRLLGKKNSTTKPVENKISGLYHDAQGFGQGVRTGTEVTRVNPLFSLNHEKKGWVTQRNNSIGYGKRVVNPLFKQEQENVEGEISPAMKKYFERHGINVQYHNITNNMGIVHHDVASHSNYARNVLSKGSIKYGNNVVTKPVIVNTAKGPTLLVETTFAGKRKPNVNST